MSTVANIGIIYGLGVGVTILIASGIVWGHASPSDERFAARLALASPIWPVLLLGLPVLAVVALMEVADIGGKKDQSCMTIPDYDEAWRM